ncbi:hypothetical protein EG329_001449 [Mollisiaceae sp. DMI_Dod_QoI]|nr:hypothetical protein EG329_001449 [Helotiales sp. DMI_Dod_QoI]
MAKRRKAAQATIKRSIESIEPPLTNIKSLEKTRRSIILPTSQCNPPLTRETKAVRKVTTRSELDSAKEARSPPFPCQIAQVVIPACLQHIASSPRSAVGSVPVLLRPRTKPSLTNSISFGGPNSSSEAGDSVRTDDVSAVENRPREDGEEYDVERILAEKKGSCVHEFLVQWVGYDEPTWVPADDCFCEDLIKAFRAIPRARTLKTRRTHQEVVLEQLQQRELRAQRRAEKRSVRPPPYRAQSLETEAIQNAATVELLSQARPKIDQVEASGKLGGTILPRCARANTARFSTRPPTPVMAHVPRDVATGEILQRSKAENNVQMVSVSNAAREDIGKTHLDPGNEREIQNSSQTAVVENTQVQADESRKPEYVEAKRQQKRTTVGQRMNRPRPKKLQRQSREGAKKYTDWGTKKREARLSVHIRFDESEMAIDATPLGMPSLCLFTSRPDTACGDALRNALIQEKKAARPSLLRHEFSSHMSQKHAESLINQTRASPERAFGFSLSSNSILLSIEKDED